MLTRGTLGTGKTLLAKAIACNIDANFLKVGVGMGSWYCCAAVSLAVAL